MTKAAVFTIGYWLLAGHSIWVSVRVLGCVISNVTRSCGRFSCTLNWKGLVRGGEQLQYSFWGYSKCSLPKGRIKPPSVWSANNLLHLLTPLTPSHVWLWHRKRGEVLAHQKVRFLILQPAYQGVLGKQAERQFASDGCGSSVWIHEWWGSAVGMTHWTWLIKHKMQESYCKNAANLAKCLIKRFMIV